jgi:hypothetical protein
MKLPLPITALTCLMFFTACEKDKKCKLSDKNIESFSFSGITDSVKVHIDQLTDSIVVEVPAGTDVKKLTPEIKISPCAMVNPTSGEEKDFSQPVTYTVIALDGSKRKYTVTVSLRRGNILGKWFLYETSTSIYINETILATDTFRVSSGTLPARKFYIEFKMDSTGSALLSEGTSPQLFAYSIKSNSTLQLRTTDAGGGISDFDYRFKPVNL